MGRRKTLPKHEVGQMDGDKLRKSLPWWKLALTLQLSKPLYWYMPRKMLVEPDKKWLLV
jgi:hypothetical protein